jgi:CheY-like chemotaxis protein
MAQPQPSGPAFRLDGLACPDDWLRGTRILIVDDHLDSREALRLVTESFGATVLAAEDGFEGLAIAHDWTPDLVLCDLRMPGLDGYTFLHRLREDPRLRGIRVLAVSAFGSDADMKRTRLAGFVGHIVKPIDYELLAGMLARVFWAPRPV